jgi:uncharacterized protein (DUF58 family)
MPATNDETPAHLRPVDAGEILRLANTYRIQPEVRSSVGIVGRRQGRETGASVEIQDFRDYVPGDDPRRIDWMAYGRTDRLVVRLFREEVSPFFDLIVDPTASMAVPDGRKHALCAELCRWAFHSAKAEGMPVRLFAAGPQMARFEDPEELRFDAAESVLFNAPNRAAGGLRRSSVRLLLTDFLSPAGPETVIRALSATCSTFIVVHVLGPWEADPSPEGPALLVGAEDGRTADLRLDSAAVEGYRRRLHALIAVVREELFRCGGLFVPVVADQSLETVLRDDFLPLGLVEVV